MKKSVVTIAVCFATGLIAASGYAEDDPHAHGQEEREREHAKHESHHYGEVLMEHGGEHHHRFDDAEKWAAVFDAEERDKWQMPDHVLRVLGLAEDSKVADIGASTGYFAVRFAHALPKGMVYGIDIEPDMDRYLRERAVEEGLKNLVSILGEPHDPRIPEPVDLVFVCNTYHHIGDRPAYFARLREKLRPGGRIAIVDYFARELPIGPPLAMKISAAGVIEEFEEAGYRLADRNEELPYQYVLLFERTAE